MSFVRQEATGDCFEHCSPSQTATVTHRWVMFAAIVVLDALRYGPTGPRKRLQNTVVAWREFAATRVRSMAPVKR